MPDYITHLEHTLLLPLTQREHLALSLALPAFLHRPSNPPCEGPQLTL